MFTDRAKLIALAIVHIFETSKPLGDYSAVAVLDDGAGISYGINQFTHRSGSLFAVVRSYLSQNPAVGVDEITRSLPTLRLTTPDAIRSLSNNAALKNALARAGSTPEMRAAQQKVMTERYLTPAIEACEGSHFELPLSLAVIYDAMNHGSYAKIRDRDHITHEQIAERVTVDHSEHGLSEAFEKAWITEYVRLRDAWLASVPRLNSTRYRTRFFMNQIHAGNWQLALPVTVQGVKLTDALLGTDSAAAPVVEPTSTGNVSVARPNPMPSENPSGIEPPPTTTTTTETTANPSTQSVLQETIKTSAGDHPSQAATQVSQNGGLINKILGGGTATAIGGAVLTWATGHIDGVAVIAICITVIILAVIFHGTITDVIRMQAAADPNKFNVK
jgi:hypothetical protein